MLEDVTRHDKWRKYIIGFDFFSRLGALDRRDSNDNLLVSSVSSPSYFKLTSIETIDVYRIIDKINIYEKPQP